MKFRKRPVIIEATQWMKGGDHPSVATYRGPKWHAAVYGDGAKGCEQCCCHWADHGEIATLEGNMIACPGDWIITGIQGEQYPCKPGIFAATYEEVTE